MLFAAGKGGEQIVIEPDIDNGLDEIPIGEGQDNLSEDLLTVAGKENGKNRPGKIARPRGSKNVAQSLGNILNLPSVPCLFSDRGFVRSKNAQRL